MTQRNGRRSVRIPIRDGFSLWGKVPGLAGVYDALSFAYRPALPVRVAEYLAAPKLTAEKQLDAMLGLIVEHVVSWDEDCPITREHLRHVYYPVLLAMTDHVCGYSPADLEKNSPTSPEVSASPSAPRT